jgi:hypothetical protein
MPLDLRRMAAAAALRRVKVQPAVAEALAVRAIQPSNRLQAKPRYQRVKNGVA